LIRYSIRLKCLAPVCTYSWCFHIAICCDFYPANLLSLQKAILDLDPVHRMMPNRKKLKLSDETCAQFNNLYLDTTKGQLDCLSFINGLGDYNRAKQESELIEVEDMKIWML
jgi:hypothetical protein